MWGNPSCARIWAVSDCRGTGPLKGRRSGFPRACSVQASGSPSSESPQRRCLERGMFLEASPARNLPKSQHQQTESTSFLRASEIPTRQRDAGQVAPDSRAAETKGPWVFWSFDLRYTSFVVGCIPPFSAKGSSGFGLPTCLHSSCALR